MKRKYGFLFSLILLLMIPTTAYGQLWTGIIDPSRAIDWSNPGIPGGIPNRTTICATLNPGATSAQIDSAIAACNNGVVFLNAGTYSLSGGITLRGKSNVTLRGAGPDQTILHFTGADPCDSFPANVCVKGTSAVGVWGVPSANIHNWTAGYAKGTTQITLDSTVGVTTGMILVLDQLDDSTDTGGVVVNGQAISAFSIEGNAPGRPSRTQQQYVKVTAISGTQVTISPGLYMSNWRASQQPQVWFWGDTSQTAFMDGIEDMTLDHSASNETPGMMFWNAYTNWVKNVKSLTPNRNHIWLYQSARTEVRDSYFYGTKNAATQSYGVEYFMTSDDLVINNVFQHITCPIMTGPSEGAVAAYNYMIDMYYSTVPNWQMWGINGSHDTGTGMNLFEGNQGDGFGMDLYHGPGALPTAFRNQLTKEPNKGSNTEVVSIWAYNRFANIVGNVLGTIGYHTVYEDSRGPQGQTGNSNHSIFLLGYSGVDESISSGIAYDLLAVNGLLRWGNYDTVTGAARWNASEVPSSVSPYSNAVPANRNLPASFFLSAKPSFWGTMPWPAIGPDVAGGTDPTGHVFANPALTCYNITPKDSNGVLLFKANNCYGAVTLPAAPTNLSVVVN